MIKELEDRIEQRTVEVESVGCMKKQLELSNAQLQMKTDQLSTELRESETRFLLQFVLNFLLNDTDTVNI